MNLKETYNRIAGDWYKDHQQDDWWIEGTDQFVSLLQSDALVLDVGCGAGMKSKYLMGKGLRVVGIDFSEKMVEIAQREVPNGVFRVCDLSEVDTLDYTFDGIFIQAVLLHVPKKEAEEKLMRMTRTLKGNGYLYVAVKEKRPEGVDEEVKVENDYGYSYERFFSYFTRGEIESHLQNLGLKVVYSGTHSSGKTNWIQAIGQNVLRDEN